MSNTVDRFGEIIHGHDLIGGLVVKMIKGHDGFLFCRGVEGIDNFGIEFVLIESGSGTNIYIRNRRFVNTFSGGIGEIVRTGSIILVLENNIIPFRHIQ